MDNFTLSTPRICDCGGDMSKQWYVYFRGKKNITGESKQFRFKLGIKQIWQKTRMLGVYKRMYKEVLQQWLQHLTATK